MPFLGNQPVEGYKTTAKQTITGDGSSSYVLDNKVTSASDLEVFINNVRQEPGVDYTASGNTITFTTAVTSSDSCWLVYQGKAATTTTVGTDNIADSAITAAKLSDTYLTEVADESITSAKIASGAITAAKIANGAVDQITKSTTAPASPSNGDFWYDTDDFAFYYYDGTGWQLIKNAFGASGGTVTDGGGFRYHTFTSSGTFTVTKGTNEVDYLIIAGGGGGATSYGGGGGAGGYLSGSTTVSANNYSIVIGGGGSAASRSSGSQYNGGNSSAFSLTAIGGGAGGGDDYNGIAGGSGGGASDNSRSGGAGTSGQGYRGGNTADDNSGGAGGGGAGGQGADVTSGNYSSASSHYGGAGKTWEDGTTRASGGCGAFKQNGNNIGPITGGGGRGGGSPTAGTANTGGGGGGGTSNGTNGGSGVVIIRYAI